MVRYCLAIRPDCTTSEIIFFIEEKGYILAKNIRTFTNPVGFLLSSVPKCLKGRRSNAGGNGRDLPKNTGKRRNAGKAGASGYTEVDD